jgi:(2S)-methylsuccinyl-CoA dehydrogenase
MMAATQDRRQTGELFAAADRALERVQTLVERARQRLARRLAPGGVLDAGRFEEEQMAAHGLAWYEVYRCALGQLRAWADRLATSGRFGTRERLIFELGTGEYLARMAGGVPMSQLEYARPQAIGLDGTDLETFLSSEVRGFCRLAADPVRLRALAELITDGEFGDPADSSEELTLIREQFRRFTDDRIIPFAHRWHLEDQLVPLELIDELAALGVFGLTVPERWGGLGMGKEAMCVVTEELSRGWIGVGSLSTRSEIAAELVRLGGTEAQRQRWLPKIASGELIPTAVFTEPDVGSDLASLRTRAVRRDGVYEVYGSKTWITHAARADLMTLLVRTDPSDPSYRGLSMLIAEKPRGTDADPFPVEGLSGSEIPVLGYRGMKEYTLSFDGFRVPVDNLLGGVEGRGFKQLMATFESARIQTAARAVGVARAALELGLAYARERRQFGKPIFSFPRVHGKLAWMAVELMIARQLTLFAAREKDAERRCDLEAGLAKLLAAQVAWAAADNAVQIHGGNGYALEFPISRVLCDARILNIFEGAAEIQAQVIARRLLTE